MNNLEFAKEIERLLWTGETESPDLNENLARVRELLQDHDDTLRAHIALTETLLRSTLWANSEKLSACLLWALVTLQNQERLKFETGI